MFSCLCQINSFSFVLELFPAFVVFTPVFFSMYTDYSLSYHFDYYSLSFSSYYVFVNYWWGVGSKFTSLSLFFDVCLLQISSVHDTLAHCRWCCYPVLSALCVCVCLYVSVVLCANRRFNIIWLKTADCWREWSIIADWLMFACACVNICALVCDTWSSDKAAGNALYVSNLTNPKGLGLALPRLSLYCFLSLSLFVCANLIA